MKTSPLALLLPVHSCGLTLDHNPHKGVYETVAQWFETADHKEFYDWKDAEAIAEAIETNELWTLQWYPETPISFHSIAAPTLVALLELAKECK